MVIYLIVCHLVVRFNCSYFDSFQVNTSYVLHKHMMYLLEML